MTTRICLDARYAGGEAPLKIAIAFNHETAYIPTGYKVSPSQWDKTSQSVLNHPQKKELNTLLRMKLSSVEREILKLESLGATKGKSALEVRDMILCEIDPNARVKKEKESTFLYRFERVISLKEGQTKDSYEWTLKRLKEYDKNLHKKRFDDIDHDYLQDFMSHCHELSINSRSILLRNIRHVFNDAIDAGVTSFYPFRRFSIKSEKTRKLALNIDQMKLLKQTDSKQENEYRDMFMLMFYLRGINSIDLFTAKNTQIIDGRLEYRRSKVGALLSVKIEPEAWAIINRYRGREYILNIMERYKSYKAYTDHMNIGLKRFGCTREKCNRKGKGFFPLLSTNWARHTWSTIGINIGISKEIVSYGMAHSFGSEVTDIYIDIDQKKIDEANRKIIDALK